MFANFLGLVNSDNNIQIQGVWKSLSKNDSYFSSSFKYYLIGDKKGYTMFDGCQTMDGGGNFDAVFAFNNEPNNTIFV